MKIFDEMEKRGHEELIFNYFKDVDLKMIISLHDTTMGKTIGGLRMSRYKSDMEAVIESLRLSQGMTYEAATAETDSGGGSAILIGNPGTDKNEAYLRAVGRFVESLKGKLILSPDLGTESLDFKHIQRETNNTIFNEDIQDNTKSTAQITAYGVYWGIKACAKHVFGSSDLSGRSFAVQGVGNVGRFVVEYLKRENTTIYISDLVYDNLKEVEDKYPDIQVVKPSTILFMDTDFVIPCAVGSVLNKENISLLQSKVIAGPALNIFSDDDLIESLHRMGIIYAPAFLLAAGDLFLLDKNLKLGSVSENMEGTKIIYNLLRDILQRASDLGVSPYRMAMEYAMERYRQIKSINHILCCG
ncbi:MAG: Glu/Leu/Phe/Val dehydrogenase dimerization domain-containing protein [Candidatus Omnitrophota bacterium]